MIPVPTGVRIWVATGATDMRKGMQGLALLVQLNAISPTWSKRDWYQSQRHRQKTASLRGTVCRSAQALKFSVHPGVM